MLWMFNYSIIIFTAALITATDSLPWLQTTDGGIA